MISKNKKAQLGKIITTFPILVLLILIMAAFVFISINFAKLKAPSGQSPITVANAENNLLLKTADISISENPPEKILVNDAVALMFEGKVKETDLTNFFQSLLNEKNSCYLFFDTNAEGTTGFVFGYKYTITGPSEILNYNIYEDKLLLNQIGSRNIKHYFGPCTE